MAPRGIYTNIVTFCEYLYRTYLYHLAVNTIVLQRHVRCYSIISMLLDNIYVTL